MSSAKKKDDPEMANTATMADLKEAAPTPVDQQGTTPIITTESGEAKKAGGGGGLMRRMGTGVRDYAQKLAWDYMAVGKDMLEGSRQKPIKAAAYGLALLGLVYTARSNPDERALQCRLAQLRQQMLLIPVSIHSRRADACLERYTDLLNGGRLDVLSLWFFTLLVERPYGKKSNFYMAVDRTTRKWPWTEIWENCVDIGAFGRFWWLENSFRECDCCEEEEFAKLEK